MNAADAIALEVHLAFDQDAQVWYVASSEIPGLRLEEADPMALVRRLTEAAGALMRLNEASRAGGSDVRVGLLPIFDSAFPIAA